MCGIVGAVAQRDVVAILIEGLKRLEYRGYDSAGVAVLDSDLNIQRVRAAGKVSALDAQIKNNEISGGLGIAHTRWATHGKPCVENAHPHNYNNRISVVHNGIIENYSELKKKLQEQGYKFASETDTEVIAALIYKESQNAVSFNEAVKSALVQLDGAYAIGVIDVNNPGKIIAARQGSPLVLGVGIGENFLASDPLAISPVVDKFIYLEDGDMAILTREKIAVYDKNDEPVNRIIQNKEIHYDSADKGHYRHFMLKEIFEQPEAIESTLAGKIHKDKVLLESFGDKAKEVFSKVKLVQIVACGSSYYAGMLAKYWIEELANVPCQVEIASEFRYRKHVEQPGTLFVTISQSGETADTLAALRMVKDRGYLATLCICNAPQSTLVRESDLVFLTRAGIEVGVASTKALSTQLLSLILLSVALGKDRGLSDSLEREVISNLRQLPGFIEAFLGLDANIQKLAKSFHNKKHCLFIGRGTQYPVALEGALKLKEISYIHAEAYPAGELKHGPLALVDDNMPVIVMAANNDLLDKLKSNIQEVRARGGQVVVFSSFGTNIESAPGVEVVKMPAIDNLIAPIAFLIPLQLLSYYVGVLKGTDVDQPRNLAKSVTVE